MFLLLILAIASLFIPVVFQFALRTLLTVEAWRHGSRVEIEKIAGSFYEPVELTNARWTYSSPAGSVGRISIESAEADFNWPALLPWQGGRWFSRLALNGVIGKVDIPVVVKRDVATPTATPRSEKTAPLSWPAPSVVEANGVDLTFVTGGNSTRIQDSRWIISELELGVVEAGQIEIKQPWLNRTFRNVRGTTGLSASEVLISDLQLDENVLIKSASADLRKMATGVLDLDLLIQAFGGEIRTQAETTPSEHEVQVSATTTFSQINLASLATFLGLSEAAGGIIEEGSKFNFRGALGDWARSNSSLRLTVRNFQWESRQWDSLVLGATLLDRRVQIPEFQLKQGQNELSLTGEFALPRDGTQWWQNEFAMNVAGKIENLTELSALVLPDFQYAAGKATIDGNIRGRDQQFHGQLIVSGSDLTWRKAPIKELHAALRLNGNELQLATLDLINRDDYVHGRGVINILGAKQYWGELRASVEDLAVYSSLLQKPLVPEPLAGGAVVSWSGEGSAERYSGSFFARLQKVRSLGATGGQLHPVNAELEGTYAPAALQFSRFGVSDDMSSFTAKVQLGQKNVTLSEIQLKQGMEVRLEGDATLPLDVWSAWPGGDMSKFLSENTPSQFKLRAKNLRLGEALRLSGWNWALDGGVTGEISGRGAGPALDLGGTLALREGRLPLGWNGDALTEVSADLSLAGPKLAIAAATMKHASGAYTVGGAIDLQNLRDPWLDLTFASKEATARLLPEMRVPSELSLDPAGERLGLQAISQLELHLTGPAHAATIAGEVGVIRFATEKPFDLQPLWTAKSSAVPAFFEWANEPWAGCKLDLHCTSLLGNNPPSWMADLKLSGTGAAPQLAGTVKLYGPIDLALGNGAEPLVLSNGFPLRATAGSITFKPGTPIDPTLDFAFEGTLHSIPFHASIIGPLSHRIAFIDSEEARQILAGLAPGSGNAPAARPLVFPWRPADPVPPKSSDAPPAPAAPSTPPASTSAAPAAPPVTAAAPAPPEAAK